MDVDLEKAGKSKETGLGVNRKVGEPVKLSNSLFFFRFLATLSLRDAVLVWRFSSLFKLPDLVWDWFESYRSDRTDTPSNIKYVIKR
jgi:hypothetical protein